MDISLPSGGSGSNNVSILSRPFPAPPDLRIACSYPEPRNTVNGKNPGGRIAAVLHHDLRLDMRRACQVIMSARNGLPDFPVSASAIQVVTPFNIP